MKLPAILPDKTMGLPHMPQLDGLRAFAVTAVLIHHYIPGGWNLGANLGVKLFFVLSGFLITSILIRSRNRTETENGNCFGALKVFYIRRFLRIFPLYYFVVFSAIILNVEYAREFSPYLLTYTLNLKMASQGWYIDHLAHFWSLSIEEQFYLLWPWVVLLLPRKALIPSIVALALLGPGYRLYLVIGWEYFDLQTPGLASYISTLSSFDTLGIGAFLSLLVHSSLSPIALKRLMRILLAAGVVTFGFLQIPVQLDTKWIWELLLQDVAAAFVFAWLVYRAGEGFPGAIGRLLKMGPISYIGKISYGIYVYHPLVPALFGSFAAWFSLSFEQFTPAGFLLCTAGTLFVSSLSWLVLERPINDLKRHFRG